MERNKIFRRAFTASLPVLMGYTAMGAAAGMLLAGKVKRPDIVLWAALSSMSSISGALQFAVAEWISCRTALLDVALLTLFLNIRYAMYGLSLLEKFRPAGFLKKCYLIWSLTDETYALETAERSETPQEGISRCLTVAALNHCYWVIGVTAGAAAGQLLPFDTRGIDFAMTALFLVVLTDQCRQRRNRLPAAIGALSAAAGRIFFSVENMLIPAMVLMTAALLFCRKRLQGNDAQELRQ